MFDTPILLLIFNRPNHARTVLRRIREVKPKQFFIVADGPRVGNEHDQGMCQLTRDTVMELIDWECELKTLFREENLGCGLGPANGITWFFQQVEAGIILEDDCLPSKSFFSFCSVILKKYKNDPEIMAISGSNYLRKYRANVVDYFFSDGGNWGWASWRRAWSLFDYTISSWPTADEEKRKLITSYYPDFELEYQKLSNGQNHIWDIQWHYARLYHKGLSITPALNLVSNIGFDSDANHTFNPNDAFANIPHFEMKISKDMIAPRERQIDLTYRKEMIQMSNGLTMWRRIFNKLGRLLSY